MLYLHFCDKILTSIFGNHTHSVHSVHVYLSTAAHSEKCFLIRGIPEISATGGVRNVAADCEMRLLIVLWLQSPLSGESPYM